MNLTTVNFNNRREIARMKWYHLIMVTPEIARLILDKYNRQNRSMKMQMVLTCAKDMRAGTFKDNGDCIRFDTEGYLLDGQHRLEAVCVAEVTIPLVFRFGLAPDVMDTIDDGRKRTAADVLTIKEIANPTITAAASRLVIRFREGGNQRNVSKTRLTNQDVLRFVLDNPKIVDYADIAQKHYVGGDKLIVGSLEAALLFLCDGQYGGKDVEFFQQLTSGVGYTDDDVVHQLRNRLIKDARSKTSNLTTVAKYLMVAKALQLFVTDRLYNKLYVNYANKRVIDMIPHLNTEVVDG